MKRAFARSAHVFPVLLTGLFLILWAIFFHGFLYDDSYIAFRFSSHWADGQGLVWNTGWDAVEGFTSFAWVAIGAFLQLFGLLPDVAMPWVGVAAWAGAMAFILPGMIQIVFDQGQPQGHSQKWIKMLALVALMSNAAIGFQAFHGLETALFALAILLVVHQAMQSESVRDHVLLAAFSTFLIMARPDGAAIVLPVWGVALVLEAKSRKNVLIGGIALAAMLAIYTALKWLYFGYPFPNTFYIKEAAETLAGMSYVQEYVILLAPVLVFLVYASGRIGLVRTLTDRKFMLTISPAVLFTAAYIWIDPILGNIYRFIIPTLPLFLLAGLRLYSLVSASQEDLARETSPLSRSREAFLFLALALVVVNVLFNVKVYRNYAFLKVYLDDSDATRERYGVLLQEANALSPAPLLATGDIGAIPYFSDLPTLDIIGLSDETVAHEGLTHEYILSRRPDLLILQDFYFTGSDLILMCGPQGYDNPLLDINEKEVSLNLTRYTKILEDPTRAHNGKGSTYQMVTVPGFAENYAYVLAWDFGGTPYHVFVRRAYPQFDALVKILQAGQ